MKGGNKTKKQVINERIIRRQRIPGLEVSEAESEQREEEINGAAERMGNHF